MKYVFISEQLSLRTLRLGELCRVLKVSRSGYYAWLKRQRQPHASQRMMVTDALVADIRRIHTDSCERYGSPRVWQALIQLGKRHSRKRVARLMAQHGLHARRVYRRVRTTQANPHLVAAPNVLARL